MSRKAKSPGTKAAAKSAGRIAAKSPAKPAVKAAGKSKAAPKSSAVSKVVKSAKSAKAKRPRAGIAAVPVMPAELAPPATTILTRPAGSKLAGQGRSMRRSRAATMRKAKFGVGQVVRHKHYPFRGIVFDIDPVFASTEEWWLSIPAEMRPKKNQPFYHLLAENDETEYIAYVSEQNLQADTSGSPIRHPQLSEFFVDNGDGTYRAVFMSRH